MNIHEFGKDNKKVILLIHPSLVKWDYFEYILPLLEQDYHLIVPALPGYDFDENSDFTSVEEIADDLIEWLTDHNINHLFAVYGCSMGGSIALLTALRTQVIIDHCVIDGGITPYRLPWMITRLIALKDYLMMMLGRAGGTKLLEKVFSTDEYSKEDLEYVSEVLQHCSRKTLWRTFDSCNNYKLPDPLPKINTKIHYWFAENEQKARKADIRYMKDFFPDTVFDRYPDLGHAGLVLLKPELFTEKIKQLDADIFIEVKR